VGELVQHALGYTAGYCDASAFGAGGVWFEAEQHLDPMVGRILQWPKDVTDAVVSTTNPDGNSDWEMAGAQPFISSRFPFIGKEPDCHVSQ
jgi:hypothetical protein